MLDGGVEILIVMAGAEAHARVDFGHHVAHKIKECGCCLFHVPNGRESRRLPMWPERSPRERCCGLLPALAPRFALAPARFACPGKAEAAGKASQSRSTTCSGGPGRPGPDGRVRSDR